MFQQTAKTFLTWSCWEECLRPRHTMRQIAATSHLVCTSAAAASRCDKTLVLGTQANLEEGKCELVSKFNTADQRIQRRCNKKKLLVLFMMLLGDDEYKQPKGWIISSGLNFSIVFVISIPQDSSFFRKLDCYSTCSYIPSWGGRNLGLLWFFILVHMFGRHFEWFSEESWGNNWRSLIGWF